MRGDHSLFRKGYSRDARKTGSSPTLGEKNGNPPQLYIRTGNATRALDLRQINEYSAGLAVPLTAETPQKSVRDLTG